MLYFTDIGWVHNVRVVISIYYDFGYTLYYDLYQDIIDGNTHKEIKIYEYQYKVEDNLLFFLVSGLYRNEVCGETKNSYENYLFNLFNDNNKWIEDLPSNHKDNNKFYKTILF